MIMLLRACSRLRSCHRVVLLSTMAFVCLSAQAQSEDHDTSLDALFGDSLAGSNAGGDLESVTDGLQSVPESPATLRVKSEFQTPDHRAELVHAFAAQRVLLSTETGCVSALPNRETISFVELGKLPGASQAFAVCMRIRSQIGRGMNFSVAIVDSKNRRIARATGEIDFSQLAVRDHALQFPPVNFRMYGAHFLVLDLDGKEVGRLPLLDVRKPATPPTGP